jgi:hypothetical protein
MECLNTPDTDHYVTFGDAYEALEACEDLAVILGRLKRQAMLGDSAWSHCKQELSAIESSVLAIIPQLQPVCS